MAHLAQLLSWMPAWIGQALTHTELDLSAAPVLDMGDIVQNGAFARDTVDVFRDHDVLSPMTFAAQV